ncbi:hypothetical protein Amn_24150 [Aminobacter sp. Y103A]|uniref:hypothetical protein n=1 Tax=Aminobacter sp. Y103A TaxID=1870862 RepID=UPI0025736F43|nr:hypothetical protein [Aminobacter sp. SS-2016]BBD37535.1 hypothetical protein Amn_24150 [Aminobacter sp. SS-2016]
MPVGQVLMTSPKGFGFIKGEPAIYFRMRDADGTPVHGENVRYDIDVIHGRPRAVNVRVVDSAALEECARVFGKA